MLAGRRFIIRVKGKDFKALLCKNVKPNELPWRISWFAVDMIPQPHITLTQEEADQILLGNLPEAIMNKLKVRLEEVEVVF